MKNPFITLIKSIFLLRFKLKQKLILIPLIIFSISINATNGHGIDKELTMNFNNVALEFVLNEIERQTEFRFVYKIDDINLDQKISLNTKNSTVEVILERLFKEKSISYNIVDFRVYLKKTDLNQGKSSNEPKVIEGIVKDNNGMPLPGATVVIVGTTTGVTTDFEGKFSISTSIENTILEITYVGFKSKQVTITDSLFIEISLEEDLAGLDEVLLIGYGSQKKSDITGTVASIPEDRLDMVPNVNVAQAIQGAVPGVVISQATGGVEAEPSILIRGRNSITASNTPLIVLDGVPYGGLLNNINPNDVQSMEVLQDASATAIYGSRGANGVILITTKKGQTGEPKIEFDSKLISQKAIHLPHLLNGEEFYNYKQLRAPSDIQLEETAMIEAGESTDWIDLAFRNGLSTMNNLSVQGGTSKTSYYISVGYTDLEGVTVNDDLKRTSGRINLKTSIADWLEIGTNTQLVHIDRSGVSPEWGASYGDIFGAPPLSRAYDENGQLLRLPAPWDTGSANPLKGQIWDNDDTSFQVVSNNYLKVEVPFIPGFSYTSNIGIRRFNNDAYTYMDRRTTDTGESESVNALETYLLFDNLFSYKRSFGKNTISATGLYSFEKTKNKSTNTIAEGFPNDFTTYYSIDQAESVKTDYDFSEQILISQMFRLNYAYDSKYLLTATIRRDGYSGFGSNNKWGIFPSFALGYNIAKEDYFPWKNVINDLKLRVSYGKNGNQGVSPYSTLTTLSNTDYLSGNNLDYITGSTPLPGYAPATLGQDDLGWETSSSVNVGVDFGLFKNRITGTVNMFKTQTSDLLLNRSISSLHGINSITQNIGETENKGIEFSINSNNITNNNFQWSTSGNFSIMRNKITSIYGTLDEDQNEIDDLSNNWFIGEPILVAFGYKYIGTWQEDEAAEAAVYGSEPGFVKLLDLNNDGEMSPEDRVIQGQLDPKFTWGMNNAFTYKNFNLSVFLHGVHGVTKASDRLQESNSNVRLTTTVKPWWTPENPTNDWIKNDVLANQMGGVSYTLYEDASFIRIKDITLSYDIPSDSRLQTRLYASGRNLFTITDWHTDPELLSSFSAPMQQELVLGLTVKF